MNLIIALKTGLPFRRKTIGLWLTSTEHTNYTLTREDILALDWEVEEPILRIEKADLYEALDRQPEGFGSEFTDRVWEELIKVIKEENK